VTGDGARAMAPAGADRTRYLSQFQTLGLMVQFLLGMVVYMAGLPSRARGSAHTVSIVVLSAHIVVAVGLAAGAVLILRSTAASPDWRRWLARAGAAVVAVAVAAGILTLVTSNGWWSFVMAAGFTLALMAYAGLLIPATADQSPALNGVRPARRGR
jgi:hypothetical protein